MKYRINQILCSLVLTYGACTSPAFSAMSISEDSIMRRDDSVDAHNKQVGAEMVREKTRATLTQAKLVYEMSERLGQANATSRWEVYEKLIDLLNARLANRVADHVVKMAGLDEEIGVLRHSWRDGSSRVDLARLAKLMLEKRESALALAEGNLADFREIADARKNMSEIQEELFKRNSISEEDRHLAMVQKNQAFAELTIAESEYEVKKGHLEQAKRDLEDVGGSH